MIRRVLAIVLLAATLIATGVLFARLSGGNFGEVLLAISQIPASVWALLIPLTVVFYVLDWIRFRSVLEVLGHRLRFVDGLRLTCVSYFVTSLTPTAELHTPAMAYMLSNKGVPIPDGLAATVTKSIYMTLWICGVCYVALLFDRSIVLPAMLRAGLPLLVSPLLAITALLVAIAFFPRQIAGWTSGVAVKWRPSWLFEPLMAGIAHCTESISRIGRSGNLQHLVCHVASVVFLLVYVCIGWILARHFGFSISFLHALGIFSTSLMVAYLSPVPGSIGVTELTTSYLLDPGFTREGMAVAITLRILCWYLVALPGGLVLANEFRKGGKWSFAPLPR